MSQLTERGLNMQWIHSIGLDNLWIRIRGGRGPGYEWIETLDSYANLVGETPAIAEARAWIIDRYDSKFLTRPTPAQIARERREAERAEQERIDTILKMSADSNKEVHIWLS